MIKECLEALERTTGELIDGYPTGNIFVGMTWEEHNAIKRALLELKAIKETKPSEALKILEEVKYAPSFMGGNDRYLLYLGSDKLYEKDINTIKNYILKAQEQEKKNNKLEKIIEIHDKWVSDISMGGDYAMGLINEVLKDE